MFGAEHRIFNCTLFLCMCLLTAPYAPLMPLAQLCVALTLTRTTPTQMCPFPVLANQAHTHMYIKSLLHLQSHTHTNTHTHTYTHVHKELITYTSIHAHAHAYTHTHVHKELITYTITHAHAHAYTHLHTQYPHVHKEIITYTLTHTHTHTSCAPHHQTHALVPRLPFLLNHQEAPGKNCG